MIRPPSRALALVGRRRPRPSPTPARSTSSATAPDVERRGVAARDRLAVALEQGEQALVAEGRHLDGLAEGRPALALGQRPQQRDVDDDRGRLVERADEVLALGQVDAGLAADRRVDLGDEGRRDVDDGTPRS